MHHQAIRRLRGHGKPIGVLVVRTVSIPRRHTAQHDQPQDRSPFRDPHACSLSCRWDTPSPRLRTHSMVVAREPRTCRWCHRLDCAVGTADGSVILVIVRSRRTARSCRWRTSGLRDARLRRPVTPCVELHDQDRHISYQVFLSVGRGFILLVGATNRHTRHPGSELSSLPQHRACRPGADGRNSLLSGRLMP